MPKFKKGDVVRLESDKRETAKGTRLVVREESTVPSCANANGEFVGNYDESDLTLLTGTDAAVKGSVVVRKSDNEEFTVGGVCGDIVFLVYENGEASCMPRSYKELAEKFTLKDAATDDATAEAMALLKSKGFKVVKETV